MVLMDSCPSFFLSDIFTILEMNFFFHIHVTQNSGAECDSHNITDMKTHMPRSGFSSRCSSERVDLITISQGSKEEL